jgi:hypothetical protein
MANKNDRVHGESKRSARWLRIMRRPPWRTLVVAVWVCLGIVIAYAAWSPGKDVRDGRHDLGRNAIWIGHGWLADDAWFRRDGRTDEILRYRDPARIEALATRLRDHRITDVFAHLCPAQPDGRIPGVDHDQVERFLDAFDGFRVMPWIGGVAPTPEALDAAWRSAFVESAAELLKAHARFAGVHVNIEPCPSGDPHLLALLDELRAALPQGKVLSVAAYPPPTRWHAFPEVHWDEQYYTEVAGRADQLVVMMYDTAIRQRKVYQQVVASWTRKAFRWSGDTEVLLGLPAYDDSESGYHVPRVENLRNALLGIHAGLASSDPLPANYRGVAVYCEWEMDQAEWADFAARFLRPE